MGDIERGLMVRRLDHLAREDQGAIPNLGREVNARTLQRLVELGEQVVVIGG